MCNVKCAEVHTFIFSQILPSQWCSGQSSWLSALEVRVQFQPALSSMETSFWQSCVNCYVKYNLQPHHSVCLGGAADRAGEYPCWRPWFKSPTSYFRNVMILCKFNTKGYVAEFLENLQAWWWSSSSSSVTRHLWTPPLVSGRRWWCPFGNITHV